MRITGLGRIIFGVSFAALGGLSLFVPGFVAEWGIVPRWMPAHEAVAMLAEVVLLAGGLALLLPRLARPAALVLAILLLLRLIALHAKPVAQHPLVELTWEELSESLIFVAGGWTIVSLLPRQSGARAVPGNVHAGQILFALALPAIGLSHFFYLKLTAPLIPSWLPFHVPLAYFTGAAWIAAALAILARVLARLAATLLATMVSLFTLLVWIPMLIAAPATLGNWAEFCVSAAITGAAWAVAESFGGRA
ncbi:MAG TPA: hypothetical protein VHT03_08725 [Rhizomicrobium sp.]|jgi:uncharacterized membrane protein|nr:hypothetical protein [Rhizomicrobium sp.]